MLSQFLQFMISGLTVGAVYALVGIGFSIVFNASQAINFAQGEFVMLGGMITVFVHQSGLPLAVAIPLAILATTLVGMGLKKLALDPARGASMVTIVMITIGASIFLRGLAQVLWGRDFHALPSLSGDRPIALLGATILPQSLWVIGCTVGVVAAIWFLFHHTLTGQAIRASACNPQAARLVGISQRRVLTLSFALSAALGAVAGILVAPLSLTYADVGTMLGLKGFSAAVVGGLGHPMGAIAGGLVVGLAEALTAGYLSSAYKDAVAFVIILVVLAVMPGGLFGRSRSESL